MKKVFMTLLAVIAFAVQGGDTARNNVLFDALAERDQHLFNIAFVECDAKKFRALFTEDAEFYHDVSGPTFGKDVWTLKGCPANDGVQRVLVAESLEVYPMRGYGAIQQGKHWFVEKGASTSTLAKFIHLWRFEEGEWRVARVLSFDHQSMPATARTHGAGSAPVSPVDSKLQETAQQLDDVVFEAGYNQCNIDKLATVIAKDLEFYHDQGGPLYGRQAFLDSMQNGICALDYKARRELVGKLDVFPLHDNGMLYGMIANGEHRFHAKYPGKDEYPTGIAKFTLLWLLDGDEWKLARALSFDHAGLD